MNKREKMRRVPRRKGAQYCSPACGGGCTYERYLAARKRAKALVQQLGGTRWRIRVWENIGWHSAVHLKGVDALDFSIYIHHGALDVQSSYTLLCNIGRSFSVSGKNPNALMRRAQRKIEAEIRALQQLADIVVRP